MLLVVMKDCVVASRPAANVWLIVHGLDAAPAKGTSAPAMGKALSSSVVAGSPRSVPPSSTKMYAPSQYCRKSSESARHPSSTAGSSWLVWQSGGVEVGL